MITVTKPAKIDNVLMPKPLFDKTNNSLFKLRRDIKMQKLKSWPNFYKYDIIKSTLPIEWPDSEFASYEWLPNDDFVLLNVKSHCFDWKLKQNKNSLFQFEDSPNHARIAVKLTVDCARPSNQLGPSQRHDKFGLLENIPHGEWVQETLWKYYSKARGSLSRWTAKQKAAAKSKSQGSKQGNNKQSKWILSFVAFFKLHSNSNPTRKNFNSRIWVRTNLVFMNTFFSAKSHWICAKQKSSEPHNSTSRTTIKHCCGCIRSDSRRYLSLQRASLVTMCWCHPTGTRSIFPTAHT